MSSMNVRVILYEHIFKVAEKPSNPDGIAVGVEVSPKEMWLNDCCVLNHDEDKWKVSFKYK